jgi:hypothetical protein
MVQRQPGGCAQRFDLAQAFERLRMGVHGLVATGWVGGHATEDQLMADPQRI